MTANPVPRSSTPSAPPVDVWHILAAADAASPVDAVDVVAAELGRSFGAEAVSFLIADLSGRGLVRLSHPSSLAPLGPGSRDDGESAITVDLDAGPVEQALRTQQVQVHAVEDDPASPGRWRVLAPVTERGDVLGLLEMTLVGRPTAEAMAVIARVGHLMSYVLIASRRHTELFERGERSCPLTLSAEIQQRLLPRARTCEAAAFTLVGWLEPAASIGGDTFDYSLARDVLHLSLTDAMGHGVGSALTATVGVASLRGARKVGAALVDAVQSANTALCVHAARGTEDDFVTGLVGEIHLPTATLDIVNAGHVVPFLVRSGAVSALALPPDLPLGMFMDSTYSSTRVALQPGDRIVFLTDGMLERHRGRLDIPAILERTHALHPREAVRVLTREVLLAAAHQLADDATVMCLDWHGDHDAAGGRTSVAGADPERASDPLD